MRRKSFLSNMINRVFKLLPMREQFDQGDDPFLNEYLQELTLEANGAYKTFPELYTKTRYVSVTNTLQYMCCNWGKMPFHAYRRSVLKMTNYLSTLVEEVEDEMV